MTGGSAGVGGAAASGGKDGGSAGLGGTAGTGGGVAGSGGSAPDASQDVGIGGASQGGAGGAQNTGGTQNTGGAQNTGGGVVIDAATEQPPVGPETDCTNGADDDHDGKADCEDKDCTDAGFVSIAQVPDTAQIVWWNERPLSEGPPACPGALDERFFELNNGSVTCACSCGDATGGSCAVPTAKVSVNSKADCKGNSETYAWGTCRTSVPTNWTLNGMTGGGATVASKGTCAPAVTQATAAPAFGKAVDLCSVPAQGLGAASGQVCVASSPKDYDAKACAMFAGVVDCAKIPGYTHPRKYYQAYEDTRACAVTGCSCDPAPTTCQAKVGFYSDTSCANLLKQYETDGTTCVALNPPYSSGAARSYKGVVDKTLDACAKKGVGTVTGSVAPTGETTLCCP